MAPGWIVVGALSKSTWAMMRAVPSVVSTTAKFAGSAVRSATSSAG